MGTWPLAVLIGDSQTQLGWQEGGWVAGLADTFQRRVGVVLKLSRLSFWMHQG